MIRVSSLTVRRKKPAGRVFQQEQPGDGFPNPWADPKFQQWMWAFDARAAAQTVWKSYTQGKASKRAQDETENPQMTDTIE